MGIYAPKKGLEEIAASAQGFLAQAFNANALTGTNSQAPTSQAIYWTFVPCRKGLVVNKLAVRVVTAAAGTNPTLFKLAMLSLAGVVLGQTADQKASLGSNGVAALSMTAAATAVDDGVLVALLQNGSYGTTQPAFLRGISGTAGGTAPYSTAVGPSGTGGTGQTDFPANAGSVTLGNSSSIAFWTALAT